MELFPSKKLLFNSNPNNYWYTSTYAKPKKKLMRVNP